MAWHHDGKRISPIGRPYRATGARPPDRPRHLTVAARTAVRDPLQFPPYPPLKLGSLRPQRHLETPPLARKVLRQLPLRRIQHPMVFPRQRCGMPGPAGRITLPQDRHQCRLIRHQPQFSYRRLDIPIPPRHLLFSLRCESTCAYSFHKYIATYERHGRTHSQSRSGCCSIARLRIRSVPGNASVSPIARRLM